MTYQPYPTGGSSNMVQQPSSQPSQPQSVRIAVRLMYVGAGLSALGLVVTLVLIGHLRNSIESALRRAKTTTPLTPAQIHSGANVVIVIAILIALIGIGLWLWMAWANGKGKGWARIVASVFFGLDTLSLIFNGSRTATTLIFAGLGWLVGLGALIFLWQRDTTQYIQQSQ